MAGYGTPIRLIFDDPVAMGQFGYSGGMELMAESIAIGVDRSIGGMPVPFSGGKRFGLDLNLSNSLIQIDGIFTDDDMSRRSAVGAGATAEIDFGVEIDKAFLLFDRPEISTDRFATIAVVSVTDVNGTINNISFSISGTVGTVSGSSANTRDIVVWNGSATYITAVQLASAFKTAIEAASSNRITATISASDYVDGAPNTKVTLTQANVGEMSGSTIALTHRAVSGVKRVIPYHSHFSGGISTPSAKSAGDKVQDLYGILNNTARKGSGTLGLLGPTMGVAAALAAIGVAQDIVDGDASVEKAKSGVFTSKGDYPIGIQIPYNSMIQAADGDKYAVRNFIVPTGVSKTIADKMSDGNSNPASVEFDELDNMTGIQGTVNSFTAVYDAGEQVYGFKLTFVPIDSIL